MEKRSTTSKSRYTPIVIALIVILLDQGIKLAVTSFIPETKIANTEYIRHNGMYVTIIPDWFWIINLKDGAYAFGILGQHGNHSALNMLYSTISILVIGAAILFYSLTAFPFRTRILDICAGLIAAGGIGNSLDRLCHGGSVIDYLDFIGLRHLGVRAWLVPNLTDITILVSISIAIITLTSSFILPWGSILKKNGSSIH